MASSDGPIQRLPFRTSQGIQMDALVEFLPMTTALASAWHARVQPLIDGRYASRGVASRADVGWNWNRIRARAIMHSLFLEPAIALALIVRDEHDTAFPVGMLTAVPQLWTEVQCIDRHRAFTWYLSNAPAEVYAKLLRMPPLRGVARALVDESIKQARRLGDDGAIVLHADPKGGTRLKDFYANDCGMSQLCAGDPPICPARSFKWNAVEYFYMDAVASVKFCSFHDGLR